MTKKFIIKILLFLIVSGAAVYVPLRSWKQNDIDAALAYFAGDSFYYLNVAEKSAHTGFYTFDGTQPTNGFHPMWQVILTNAAKVNSNKDSLLAFSFFASVFLNGLGIGLIFLALYDQMKSKQLLILALVPGFFYLLFSFVLNHHYSVWSNVNGMESSLQVFGLGLLLYMNSKYELISSYKPGYLIVLGLLIAFYGFIRLDSFYLLPAVLYNFYFIKNRRVKYRIFTTGFIPFLLIIGYMIYNTIYSGMALPVSGIEKNSAAVFNFVHILNLFTAGISLNELFGFNLSQRVLPLIVPLISALIFFIKYKKLKDNEKGNFENTLMALSIYVVFKTVYNLVFVDLWNQGVWYGIDNVLIFNITIIYWIDKFIKERIKPEFSGVVNKVIWIGLAGFIIVFMNNFIDLKQFHSNPAFSKFRANAAKIKIELNKKYSDYGILEFDDGVMSYYLNKPSLSGFGLCIDKDLRLAIKSGKLLDVAYQRGYRVMGSLNYFYLPGQIPDTISSYKDFCRNPFFALNRQNANKWNFRVILKDTVTGVVFVSFERK